MNNNTANIHQPIVSTTTGHAPLTLRVVTKPSNMEYTGGVPESLTKIETYVLFSALPVELQERVKVAVQALIAGG